MFGTKKKEEQQVLICPCCEQLFKYPVGMAAMGGHTMGHENGLSYPVGNCGRHTFNEYRKAMDFKDMLEDDTKKPSREFQLV